MRDKKRKLRCVPCLEGRHVVRSSGDRLAWGSNRGAIIQDGNMGLEGEGTSRGEKPSLKGSERFSNTAKGGEGEVQSKEMGRSVT